MTELAVAYCSEAAAKHAVRHWHYSQSMPSGKRVRFGAWEDGVFIGCVIYSRGASSNPGTRWGLGPTQVCELTRIALRDGHVSPVSRIVALTIRKLRSTNPGIRLVVSFADPAEGHHGGIYQAGNWVYTGVSSGSVEYHDTRSGRKFHSRQVSEKGYNVQFGVVRKAPRPSQLQKVRLPGKHRYVMPLDKSIRRAVARDALPYPPRLERPAGVEPAPPAGVAGGSPSSPRPQHEH